MLRLNKEKAKEKKIGSFSVLTLRLSGMRFATEYEIVSEGPNAECSRYAIRFGDHTDPRILEMRAVCDTLRVLELMDRCKLLSWDGFCGAHPKGVLDGTMFSLSAVVNDHQKIRASGSQNFPKHFRELTDGIEEILQGGAGSK